MVDLYEADVFAGAVKQLGKCLSTYNKLRPADDNVFVRMGTVVCCVGIRLVGKKST